MSKLLVITYFLGLAFLFVVLFIGFSTIRNAEKKEKSKKEAGKES